MGKRQKKGKKGGRGREKVEGRKREGRKEAEREVDVQKSGRE